MNQESFQKVVVVFVNSTFMITIETELTDKQTHSRIRRFLVIYKLLKCWGVTGGD